MQRSSGMTDNSKNTIDFSTTLCYYTPTQFTTEVIMSRQEAVLQYKDALKQGQKYYKAAASRGRHPFPPALDDILDESTVSGRVRLGLVNVPAELIVGVKSPGRVPALAGNFMPLLEEHSEFANKWINLCAAHLSDEGIRDPIVCYEYMGLFYVQEGNKRASVMKSYGAPSIPAMVTRIVPEYSDETDVRVYYEFMHFYQLSGLYRVHFKRSGQYARLQAALGFDESHVWTEEERRSFSAALSHFSGAFAKLNVDKRNISVSDALLAMLELFSLDEIKKQSTTDIAKTLGSIWADVQQHSQPREAQLSTEPEEDAQGMLTKLFGVGRVDFARVAFI